MADKTFNLTFSVSGWVTQRVTIVDDKYTAEKIKQGLNEGSLLTTLHGDLPSITTMADNKVVATVDDIDNECEYVDFEAEVD